MYLGARPIKQLQWYRMRKAQFARASERRGALMFVLFVFSFAATLANVVLVHWLNASETEWPSSSSITIADWLNLALLITTAISAALTYWYVSRNERSISYRYGTQAREIVSWLNQMVKILESTERYSAYEHILEFEDLSTSELIDWVHITSNDIIELTPG